MDPGAGPVQRFAHELRSLRRDGGSPSYRTMAQRTGLSVTALSRAASGERLASAAVVRAYARACGADPDEWERRREAVAEEAAPQGAEEADSPYQGLARFEPGDRDLFFGRDRLAEEALRLVVDHRFAVLHGTSGSGKSSLLRAGLLPRLDALIRERDCDMELRLITPGTRPAATHERLLDPAPDGPERFVVVDQFEEIFTLCRDRTDRWRFVDRLLAAAEPASRLRVVIAVGGSFLPRCAQHDGLAHALRHHALAVRPMTRAELQEAVVKPATAAGLRVERELTARIVEEAADRPGALPLLSQALRETWRRRTSGVLTLAAYEAAGGINGAIAAAAEEVYGRLTAVQAATARRLLQALITPGEGSTDTRRPVSLADLREWPDPELPVVLDRLAGARLVLLDEGNVELAHEALITHWPRLQAWIETNRERLREHRRLSEAARLWTERDHDPCSLYRGTQLAVADLLFDRGTSDHDLTGRERAFLSASRVADSMERWKARRIQRRMRSLAVACTVVVVGALLAAHIAWQRGNAAELQNIRATALEAAALAAETQAVDPRTAALLSVASWRLDPSPVSRAALISTLAEPEDDVLTGPVLGDDDRAFLVDSGRTLLVAGTGTWSSWDVATHRAIGSGPLPDGRVAEADPAGRTLLTGGGRLWPLTPGAGTGHPGTDGRVLGFGADGHSYVVRDHGPDPEVRLRAVDGGRTLFEAGGDASPVPSPDDSLVAVCRPGRPPEVWDTTSKVARPGDWGTARAADCSSGTVVFGAGGARLAVATDTGVRVWDTATGRQLADLAGPATGHLAFTPDGAFLAASGPGGVTVWRIAAARLPVLRRPGPGSSVTALAWAPTGRTLRYLTGSTVHSLDLGSVLAAPWRARPADAVTLSPDGRLLATAERIAAGYRLRLQETRSARVVADLPFPRLATDPADASHPLLAFSPDSSSIAYGTTGVSGPVPTARFAVREVSSAGRGGTSFTVTGPAASTARAIVLTARGRKLLVGWSTPAGSLVGRMWDTSHGVPWARSDDPKAVVKEAMAAGFAGRMAMAPVGPDPHPSFIDGRRTYELAVSTGGIHVATGGAFGTVTVRDTGTDRDPGAVIPAPSAVAGCAACARITALAFVPDGSTLAVAYGSGALRLWDLRTNRLLGDSPATSGDVIDSLAFGSDGYLYAAGPHVSVQAYPVGPAQVAARLCVRAGRRSLTVAEWRRYLPGMSYRPLCDGPRPDDGSAQSATEAGPGLVEPARTPSPPSPAVAVLPGAADEAKPTPAPDPRPRAEHRTGGNRAGSGENQRTKKRAEGNPPTPRTMPAPARKHR
ncbi:WD40 repeat domain-containing protein [Streptomyces sp. CC0208]|uniref:WD40 repeat domain-containing protein n=2 Tax=Streptomyces TaxID=1883 RepID=UPI0023E102D5|nr:WD40 repeat domain-containing protein [Streptomyces sp. CC0208]